jgi:hypothetical protein
MNEDAAMQHNKRFFFGHRMGKTNQYEVYVINIPVKIPMIVEN